MKIVYVSDAIYPYNKGGKEKRLYELSTRLSRLGHDVHIYTMHWWDGPETTRVENGVTLHAICRHFPLYKAGGDRRSIFEAIMFGLACFRLFPVTFDILDVDHMPFFPIYSAWIVCTLRGRRLYGTWHEALNRADWIKYMGFVGNIAYLIEHLSIKLPYRITAASHHTYQAISQLHNRTRNLSLITPGIDTKLLHKLSPAPITCDVLYAGRLVKDKNVDKLVRAIKLLKHDIPEIRCIIVGHGTERAHLKSLITKLDLAKNIKLIQPLESDAQVYAYMKAAKVFCLPSIREGFGMVVLEAIGCGTPVVTVNNLANNARHLIQQGQNGSIVPLQVSALADALEIWLHQSKPAATIHEVRQYDWRIKAKQQAKAYAI